MDLPMVTDSHCHLHDMRLEIKVDEIIQRAKEHQVRHVISCGCHLEDWKRLERLYLQMYNKQEETSSGFKLTLCFGLHPWWAKADNNHGNYLEKLREKLLMYPTAHLGETGLCKSAKGCQVDIEIQEQVFREQIELAADLQRSVVIHCVASHGKLLNILQDIALKRKEKELILPSSLILHSYSGSADMIKSFLALEKVAKVRVFFSYNGKQLSIPKTIESCKNTPLRSLLLETDAPDQAPLDCLEECNVIGLKVDGKLELNEPMLVQLALHRAAGIHSLVPKELGSIVQDNVNRAFPA